MSDCTERQSARRFPDHFCPTFQCGDENGGPEPRLVDRSTWRQRCLFPVSARLSIMHSAPLKKLGNSSLMHHLPPSALLRLQEVFLSVSLSLKLASQLQSEHRTLLCPLTFRQQRFGGHLCVTSTRRTRLPYTLMMNGTGAGNKGFIGTKQ